MRQWIWIVTTIFLCMKLGFVDGESSQVYQLVYHNIDVNTYHKCVRLLNGTNQVGCQSDQNGNVGILFHANTSEDLLSFYATVSTRDYVLLVDAYMFNRSLVRQLKSYSTVKGLLVYEPDEFSAPEWSPDLKCPTERIGLYNSSTPIGNCSHEWNTVGDGLTEEDIPFPVFYLLNETSRDPLLDCYYKHNVMPERYPLCAVEMKSWMHGAVDAISCRKRTKVQTTLTPVGFCDVMGGHNIVTSLKQFSKSYTGSAGSTILVTAAIDSRAFMATYSAPGVNEATGFISLLGVAYALGRLTKSEKEAMPKNVVFVLFDAEAYDNIGSTRMLSDMELNKFPTDMAKNKILPPRLKLENISSVIELRQLGLASDHIYAHFDPNSTAMPEINHMYALLNGQGKFFVKKQMLGQNIGLAPSSLHSILKKKDDIPGIVLTDYDEVFHNKRYFSRYDNLENINIKLNASASYEENLEEFRELAEKLADISTLVAKTVFQLAMEDDDSMSSSIGVGSHTMAQLLYCYLHMPNCPLLEQYLHTTSSNYLSNTTINRYISVYTSALHEIINITTLALVGFTGDETLLTPCKSDPDDFRVSYFHLQGQNNTPICYASSSFITNAYSAVFDDDDLNNYAFEPGVWAESQWATDSFQLRIFLVQDPTSQGLVLLAGLLVSLFSFLFVWFLNAKASILFQSNRQI